MDIKIVGPAPQPVMTAQQQADLAQAEMARRRRRRRR